MGIISADPSFQELEYSIERVLKDHESKPPRKEESQRESQLIPGLG